MSRIILHPEKGINPRLTVCTVCGEDAEELILVGIPDKVYEQLAVLSRKVNVEAG